ncbi:MAG TPA: chemotaxis protein CheW [Pilimelia sp.]|nr:chemotaxis protein CheW [Pilimelia sp.]
MSPARGAVALGQLREAFDHSFAAAPRPATEAGDHMLAVRVGSRPYVLRLTETAGVFAGLPLTPLPGPLPALCGVTTVRGTVVPVYDLGALLGDPPAAAPPRWLALVAGAPPLAVAFAQLDGHLKVPADALVGHPAGGAADGCLSALVRLPDQARGVVDLPTVRTRIHAMTGYPEGTPG